MRNFWHRISLKIRSRKVWFVTMEITIISSMRVIKTPSTKVTPHGTLWGSSLKTGRSPMIWTSMEWKWDSPGRRMSSLLEWNAVIMWWKSLSTSWHRITIISQIMIKWHILSYMWSVILRMVPRLPVVLATIKTISTSSHSTSSVKMIIPWWPVVNMFGSTKTYFRIICSCMVHSISTRYFRVICPYMVHSTSTRSFWVICPSTVHSTTSSTLVKTSLLFLKSSLVKSVLFGLGRVICILIIYFSTSFLFFCIKSLVLTMKLRTRLFLSRSIMPLVLSMKLRIGPALSWNILMYNIFYFQLTENTHKTYLNLPLLVPNFRLHFSSALFF